MVTDPVERKLNGSLLRDIRKVRRLGQLDVARELDISTGKVSQVESGDADYQTAELRAFSQIARVDFVDLLCWMGFAADRASQSYRSWYAQALKQADAPINPDTAAGGNSDRAAQTVRNTGAGHRSTSGFLARLIPQPMHLAC